MKFNIFKKKVVAYISLLLSVFICKGAFPVQTYASVTNTQINAKVYEFDKKSKYEITGATAEKDENTIGKLCVSGEFSISEDGDVPKIDAKENDIRVSYEFDSSILTNSSDKWHLYEDSSKEVDGIELDDKIKNGVIIVQTSLDGKKYHTDLVITNTFTTEYKNDEPIYTLKDIQLVNGCYYRVIVAYEMEIIKGKSKVLFVPTNDNEYRKNAEVYEFYAVNLSDKESSDPNASPRKELGTRYFEKKDSGFIEEIQKDEKNPHLGWNVGTFYVNGYTRESTLDGTELFLKNAGDKVTLWFKLEKDIENLDGNGKYAIVEDKNGQDLQFEVPKTNFKHGALIISFTDHEGKKHKPVVYTDFLAASATTGADTRAVLFEEGDYEVALDYTIGETGILGSEYDYKVFFQFSIRNGNTMFFPFDLSTGAELRDNAITPNGFMIDMAKSRYLNINVKRFAVVDSSNGHIEDERMNAPAKDGNEYTDEGVYIVNVTNQYTGEQTEKKFYVGSDPFLIAMAKSGKSAHEIDEFISQGYTIDTDGSLVAPIPESSNDENLVEQTTEKDDKTGLIEVDSNNSEEKPSASDQSPTVEDTQEEAESSSSFGWVIVVICIVLIAASVLFYIMRRKK